MIEKVAVIGAGTMGRGIAQVFAMYQYPVVLIDISSKQLDLAMSTIAQNLDRMLSKNRISSDLKIATLLKISSSVNLASSVTNADLVIEAVLEDESLKQKIVKELSAHCPEECIIASNTSSISITKLAAKVMNPERVIGMHFMNPVPVMQLVEVIKGHKTSKQTTQMVKEVCKRIDKIPVEVEDYPGFISNRILMPMINEAIWALHEQVGTKEAIDSIMKLGMAHPMGPLELADFIGLDVCLSIMHVLHTGFGNPKYAPCPLLVNMTNAGLLGKKSGEGFYKYPRK